MNALRAILLFLCLACAADAWAQAAPRLASIGYAYPAGGRQGTRVRLEIGGQSLRNVQAVHVTGEGVTGKFINYVPAIRRLDGHQRRELQWRINDRRAVLTGRERPKRPAPVPEAEFKPLAETHPLIALIPKANLRQLEVIQDRFFNLTREQPNTQLAELALVELTIAPDAALGDRELRLMTPAGLTNPLIIQISEWAERNEQEPNDPGAGEDLDPVPALAVPFVINGQVLPGDVDRTAFKARKGQKLVLDVQARRLIPYLADAVPGWFQATLAIYDKSGRELAFADNFRFHSDPVLLFEVPADGEYQLEIRDAIYRGRTDFVYRVLVGERPYVTHFYPLGAQVGVETVLTLGGWNLIERHAKLKPNPGSPIRQTMLRQGSTRSNPILYGVGAWFETMEKEPNDLMAGPQRITAPRFINGRIDAPGDQDVFEFEARAGDEVVAEIIARRLGSPLDAILRLTGRDGAVIAWSDDQEDPGSGLHTHHADPYLRASLPVDGIYRLHVADVQGQGGEDHGYRLRVGPPVPDFELRVEPSSVTVPAGRSTPLTVHALRRDGFAGPIELTLLDAPGFRLDGGVVPAGADHVLVTLTGPARPARQPLEVRLVGRAMIGKHSISRQAVPADERMQAFFYEHLVPARRLVVGMTNARGPVLTPALDGPLQLAASGATSVDIKLGDQPVPDNIALELVEPPAGLTLERAQLKRGELSLVLRAEGEPLAPGLAGNLVLQAFTVSAPTAGQTTGRRQPQACLPAIPFQVAPSTNSKGSAE